MSYFTFAGFKLLASNYHNIEEHSLFVEIEHLMKDVELTPAEVAEELLRHDDTQLALQELINFLEKKKKEKKEDSQSASSSDQEKKKKKKKNKK